MMEIAGKHRSCGFRRPWSLRDRGWPTSLRKYPTFRIDFTAPTRRAVPKRLLSIGR
jgi:hypothetical protein